MDSEKEEQEPTELVFTYSRQEAPKKESAANISVVTREDIQKLPASNVGEVLQYLPGVYVEPTGGLGSQATASIQGSDFRHVAVYQDGVPLNMLNNPQTDLSYLPLDVIERIEVYKGSASSAWGSSLGGVINIITREPDLSRNFKADILSSYGQFDTVREVGTFSGAADRLSYLLSLSHHQSDGFTPHSEYRQDSAYAKMNYYFGKASRVNLVCSYDEGRNASPSGLFQTESPPFWDDTFRKRAYQRILLESPLADGINWTVEGRHYQFDASTDGMHTDFIEEYLDYSDESWGMSSRITYDTNDVNRFLLGFDGDWGTYIFDMDQFGPDYVPDTFRSANWALYLNDTYNVGRFSFTAGARYDHNYDFGSEVSPSGGVVYRFMDDKALIRAQIAKGFSAPPGGWVHAPVVGNEDLKPEIGINYQLGAEASLFEYLHLEANVFRADIDDFIKLKEIEHPPWAKYENVDEVTRQGVEGVVRADFRSGLGLSFGGSFVDVRDDGTGEVLQDIPRLILNAGAYYTYPKWLTHSLAGKYVYNNSSHEETRDRVFVFDYLVRCKLPAPAAFSNISVFLAVHDLTDAGYLYQVYFPQPGRWLEGGLSLEF